MDQEEETEEILPREPMEALFELLEKLPPLSSSRNDVCSCGSGKKYKKCCLKKEKEPFPSEVRLESFQIKTDGLTPEESKNNFPAISGTDGELMSTLYHTFREHPDTIDSEDCEYFQQLNTLRAKYPDNPVILNYITTGYDLLELQDRVKELVTETYEKFPDYLFAQTAQANIHLRDGFPEKAFEVLKRTCSLKQLYPNRTVFHITEVRVFEHFMVRYFCKIEDLKQAEIHLQILEKILEEDDPVLQNAQAAFRKSKALYNLKARMSRLLRSAKKER